LDIISLIALCGGSDFVPYAGMSFTSMALRILCCKFDAQELSEEHVHHPPDEKQRYDAKNRVGDPVAS
jgi:hypothetical protein